MASLFDGYFHGFGRCAYGFKRAAYGMEGRADGMENESDVKGTPVQFEWHFPWSEMEQFGAAAPLRTLSS